MNRIQSKNHNIGLYRIKKKICLPTMIKNLNLKMDIEVYYIFINLLVNHIHIHILIFQNIWWGINFDNDFFERAIFINSDWNDCWLVYLLIADWDDCWLSWLLIFFKVKLFTKSNLSTFFVLIIYLWTTVWFKQTVVLELCFEQWEALQPSRNRCQHPGKS